MNMVTVIVYIHFGSSEYQNIMLAEKGPHFLDKGGKKKSKLCKMEAVILFQWDQRISLVYTGIITMS